MSPGPTFDRVYLALKDQLTSARFGPGDHLEPSLLGDELSASITPVRDALHRLVGERLVEAPRNDGFRVPAPTEAQLRDLYAWNRELLDLALRRQRPGAERSRWTGFGDETASAAVAAAQLFRSIASRSASEEHEAALESLNDRLGAIRASEERVFQDWRAELGSLGAAHADVRKLRHGIAAYHRRRLRSVPELLVAWRRHAGGT